MSKLKVCHISTVHGAFDDRIFYKECISLVNAGHEVSLVINHSKSEVVQGVSIIGLKETESRLNRAIFKPIIAARKALKTKAKVIHFHDPELIFLGIFFALLGKKVIYDAHENVPNQILSKTYIKPAFMRRIIAFIAKLSEHIGALFFVSVISVIPEIVSRFPKKKGLLIRNLPLLRLVKGTGAIIEKPEDKFLIIYAGGLTDIRGIKETIQAIESIDNVELWLIGQWSSDAYFEECKQEQAWDKVKYLGFKRLEEVFDHLDAADLGLCVLYPEPNYLKSLPVKAFEYMTFGKPIIMSNFPYWEKVFQGSALFVDPYDVEEIKEAIQKIINNKSLAKSLGENGKSLVLSEYSWEAEEKKLLALYNKL